jgi:hypothetical protein
MGVFQRNGKRLPARFLAVLALGVLVVAVSSGISSCNPGEESAIKKALETELRGGLDVTTIDVHGESADATTFLEGHEVEIDLVKEAGKWTIENCIDKTTHEIPSKECPLNYLDGSP